MITLTNGTIRGFLATQGLGVPEAGKLHILGLRGATPAGLSAVRIVPNILNAYNDTIILFGSQLQVYPGTVDPGRSWTLKPMNPGGVAHLCDGVYTYAIGRHKGKPALNPVGDIRIWRDADRDGTRDGPERPRVVRGADIGLNLHAVGDGPTVDDWSAGCQGVCKSGWDSFWSHIEASGQTAFRYYLADASALAAFVDRPR